MLGFDRSTNPLRVLTHWNRPKTSTEQLSIFHRSGPGARTKGTVRRALLPTLPLSNSVPPKERKAERDIAHPTRFVNVAVSLTGLLPIPFKPRNNAGTYGTMAQNVPLYKHTTTATLSQYLLSIRLLSPFDTRSRDLVIVTARSGACLDLQKRDNTPVPPLMRRGSNVHFRHWTASGGALDTVRCALIQATLSTYKRSRFNP
ncbi:hypothetical protein JVT61DRAFT_8291 [Boletus reticuloceps]|uniref:Uncharacterized protein n=1 Tax=Boletus reticuloceps TaxID=495285 RepID=A0A8I2YX04_9AGAM|nr:hypothetical protein JVT61DRAFT_8291 [Boletus reticuloceps]